MTPEEHARQTIDRQLKSAGWVVQDLAQLNLFASKGVAVRELRSQGGPADFLEAWQSVDSDEGVPLAGARKAFGNDPKSTVEELHAALIA